MDAFVTGTHHFAVSELLDYNCSVLKSFYRAMIRNVHGFPAHVLIAF